MPPKNQPTFARRLVLSYYRVSSDEQHKEGYSISSQMKLVQKYALENNLKIAEEFTDIETAKQSGRTNFGKMVARFQEHAKFSADTTLTLLVEKTDRLYRNIKDWVILDELDLEIHFVKEGQTLSKESKSSDKFIHGIKVLMAKNYVDNLAEETRKGMLEKAEQGHYPTRGPLGYCNMRRNGKSLIEPDSNAPFVANLFKKFATGNYTLNSLYEEMAKDYPILNTKGKLIARSAMHRVLGNTVYYGVYEFKGNKYVGKHQALISKELYDMVQRTFSDHYNLKTRNTKKEWLFQGLVLCENCGSLFTMEMKKGKYIYYHCTNSKKNCSVVNVREERIEEQAVALLSDIALPDDLLPLVIKALKESEKDVHDHQVKKRLDCEGQYQNLKAKLRLLYDDRLEGRISVDFYENTKAQLRFEQGELEQKMLNLTKAGYNYLDEGVKVIELAKNAGITYRNANLSQKRILLRFLLQNFSFGAGRLTPKWRQPFDLLPLMTKEWADKTEAKSPENAFCPLEHPHRESNPGLRTENPSS